MEATKKCAEKGCQFSKECKENKIAEYTSGQITLFGLFFSKLHDDIEISYAATGRRTGARSFLVRHSQANPSVALGYELLEWGLLG